MRRDILHLGAKNLKYEIREIVAVAHELQEMGLEITWENIGDPVQKGEAPPQWIKDIVTDLVQERDSWAYCDSAGVLETREFLADKVNRRGGVQVTANDIMFFNGLGACLVLWIGVLAGQKFLRISRLNRR